MDTPARQTRASQRQTNARNLKDTNGKFAISDLTQNNEKVDLRPNYNKNETDSNDMVKLEEAAAGNPKGDSFLRDSENLVNCVVVIKEEPCDLKLLKMEEETTLEDPLISHLVPNENRRSLYEIDSEDGSETQFSDDNDSDYNPKRTNLKKGWHEKLKRGGSQKACKTRERLKSDGLKEEEILLPAIEENYPEEMEGEGNALNTDDEDAEEISNEHRSNRKRKFKKNRFGRRSPTEMRKLWAKQQRERRARETIEQTEARRFKQRIIKMKNQLALQLGLSERNPDDVRAQRAHEKRQQRQKQLEVETPEEAAERKKKQAQQSSVARKRMEAVETPEETAARKAAKRDYLKKRYNEIKANETPEEQAKRKDRERLYRERVKERKLQQSLFQQSSSVDPSTGATKMTSPFTER